MRLVLSILSLFIFLPFGECQITDSLYLNNLSIELLHQIKNKESTTDIQTILQDIPLTKAEELLNDDRKKIAFWLNVYNAYIHLILIKDESLFKDKGKFYKDKHISIFGLELSFDDIEHGIIRGSEYKYFLGYLKKFRVPDWEKRLRVEQKDARVHFALNCGAIDCPPVDFYSPSDLIEKLEINTANYLREKSYFDESQNTLRITPLFKWFIGDFGGSKGVRQILIRHKILDKNSEAKIKTTTYDWTLKLYAFK